MSIASYVCSHIRGDLSSRGNSAMRESSYVHERKGRFRRHPRYFIAPSGEPRRTAGYPTFLAPAHQRKSAAKLQSSEAELQSSEAESQTSDGELRSSSAEPHSSPVHLHSGTSDQHSSPADLQ